MPEWRQNNIRTPIEVFAVHEEMILQMAKTTKNKLKLARKSLH